MSCLSLQDLLLQGSLNDISKHDEDETVNPIEQVFLREVLRTVFFLEKNMFCHCYSDETVQGYVKDIAKQDEDETLSPIEQVFFREVKRTVFGLNNWLMIVLVMKLCLFEGYFQERLG